MLRSPALRASFYGTGPIGAGEDEGKFRVSERAPPRFSESDSITSSSSHSIVGISVGVNSPLSPTVLSAPKPPSSASSSSSEGCIAVGKSIV
ncbi:hypothetical protein K1719_037886 [Acacia pycnantha]|nr:hypothetical protein K1719_037886 [Acacia pycnantha]